MPSTPVSMASELNDRYGPDWLMWDPVVLWEAIETDTNSSLSQSERDCIMAVRSALKADTAWQDWAVFLATVKALNGSDITTENPNYCTPMQIAWGVYVMEEIAGEQEFSGSVKAMVAAVFFRHGIYWLPEGKLRDIAEPYLSKILYSRQGPEASVIQEALKLSYDSYRAGDLETEEYQHTERLLMIEEYVERRSHE